MHSKYAHAHTIQHTNRSHGNEELKAGPPPTSGMPSYRSPKKARKQVDEWSVMTLYNDVSFLEEQKMMKIKAAEDKARTRQMLQVRGMCVIVFRVSVFILSICVCACVCMYLCMYVCMYTYICLCVCVCVCDEDQG